MGRRHMKPDGDFGENAKVCSCFGHRELNITDELRKNVREEIITAINDNVRIFLFGGMSDFDDLVYEIVSELKQEKNDNSIKRLFCFPLDKYLHRPPSWFVKKEYAGLICPEKSFDGWYESIYFRNCAMIDMSDIVLFCTDDIARSGSFQAYKYALKHRKNCINFIH